MPQARTTGIPVTNDKCNLVHWERGQCPMYWLTCLECSAGNTGHYIVIQGPHLQTGQTQTNYRVAEHICSFPKGTEENLQQWQEITYSCQMIILHLPRHLSLDNNTSEEDMWWPRNSDKHSPSKTTATQHSAYKTTICRHLEWDYTLHETEHQYVSSINNSKSPRKASPHPLLTFELFTLSEYLKTCLLSLIKFIFYHTILNITHGLSLIYYHFRTNLFLIYLLQYHLQTFVHKQAFQDHFTYQIDFLSRICYQEDSPLTISRSHQHNIPYQITAISRSSFLYL